MLTRRRRKQLAESWRKSSRHPECLTELLLHCRCLVCQDFVAEQKRCGLHAGMPTATPASANILRRLFAAGSLSFGETVLDFWPGDCSAHQSHLQTAAHEHQADQASAARVYRV